MDIGIYNKHLNIHNIQLYKLIYIACFVDLQILFCSLTNKYLLNFH